MISVLVFFCQKIKYKIITALVCAHLSGGCHLTAPSKLYLCVLLSQIESVRVFFGADGRIFLTKEQKDKIFMIFKVLCVMYL